jgi:signal transduction histidine kinase
MQAHSETSVDGEGVPASPDFPDHRELIGRSFFVFTRVRTSVVVVMIVATLFAQYVLRMEGLEVRRLLTLAGWMAMYNAAAYLFFRRYRDPDEPTLVYPLLLGVAYGAVILDLLSLTASVWLVGGGRSPFSAFYLPLVLVSCILLPRRAALTLSALAYALLVAMVVLELSGRAVPRLPVGAVVSAAPLSGHHALTLIVVYGLLFSLSVFLLLGITGALRRAERRMILANAELTRLSQQRRDFLHIAAHNLRAPVGAVSMLLDNMRSGFAGEVTAKQRDWLDRSLRRLSDLTEFMNDIQTLSSLETDIIKTRFSPVHLPGLVSGLVEEYRDVAEKHGHTLVLEVDDAVPPVVGNERLLKEAIVNYLTNALKYTPDGGTIRVRVLHRDPMVRVEVEDNGIGIAEEDQARLFREFVRIPPRGTEVDKAKGSGLGLSIVRRIVLAHGGRTGVCSAPGHGSTFHAEFPALTV